jgi:FkbM family methyltransferase
VSQLARLRVSLARPVIRYLARAPWPRGKGFLIRRVLPWILPPAPASFLVARPGGTRIRLQYREMLGIVALIQGGFEDAECRRMLELATPGTTAFDVGANVGIQSIPLAARLTPGRLIALEPIPANADRLRANAAANHVENIDLRVLAAGAEVGTVDLHLADDAAYATIGAVASHRDTGRSIPVAQTTLDTIWDDCGRPSVSVVKVDVEGGEVGVMVGATRMLSQERPAILVEADTPENLEAIRRVLAEHGYTHRTADGFAMWNHLFLAEPAASASASSASTTDHPAYWIP